MLNYRGVVLLAWVALTCLTACQGKQVPDYARPLPAGEKALRLVEGPWREQILEATAQQLDDPAFLESLERSVDWFTIESTKQFFPIEAITHERAQQSVTGLAEIAKIGDPATRQAKLASGFDIYESVGYDGSGIVFFTGYFSPEFAASRTRSGRYQYPLYLRPDDLKTDASTGAVLGREAADGSVSLYPDRQEIEAGDLLKGRELVYLPSRLDAYSIEVNGSAKLRLNEGGVMYVGYAGTNGREYTSIGRLLVADGVMDANTVSMPAIRSYFQQHPRKLDEYIRQNDRFVFFQEYPGTAWPAGSLGFKVTPGRTLATDKKIFPRGGAVLVTTELGDGKAFRQLMMDQDTGGAIRAPGRSDIYFGVGGPAEAIAGRQAAEGRLFYLFARP